jgi:rRNA-processing protein FCF1
MQQRKQWARATPLGRQLSTLADEVANALHALIHVSAIEERFPDDGGSVVVITPHPWRWAPLADAELPKLTSARKSLHRWRRECLATLRAIAPEFEPDFVDEINALESIVDRSGRGDGPSADTRERVLTYAHEALARQRETLRLAGIPLVPVGSETTLLVPDTNALYGNPYLDEWEGVDAATLVIVPQVNRELDKHKNESGDSVRRQKAELVIRQFEEFARRGDTITGVTIAGRLQYREEAADVEPDAEDGLHVGSDDDRILANVLHVRRRHPEAAVVLVTRDQNLKAKARRQRVTSDEPPPPRKQFKPRRPRRPTPEVVLGHPSGQVSKTPLSELHEGEHSRLIGVKPRYLIENKAPTGINDVTTGVRTRDGRTHRFDAYRA